MISTISDYFKGFVLKWEKNMCSLKKLAHKAVDGQQKPLIIRTSGTQRKDPALSTEMIGEGLEGGRTLQLSLSRRVNISVSGEEEEDKLG